MLCRRPGLVADRGANMLEYVGITIVVAAVIVAIGMTTVPSDIQAGFANGVCRIVNPDDPDCKDGGATASPAPGDSGDPTSEPTSGSPTGEPTADPTADPGTGTDSDLAQAQEEADAANKEYEDAEDEWGNLDKELLDLVADLVGWTSAKDCFTKGDIGACLETLLTAIPWGKLFKAAKMVPKIWKLFRRWQKLRKRLDDAKDAKRKADKKLDNAKKKTDCPTGNSFVRGTPVLLADGTYRPIESIRVGDRVLAADPETGRSGARTVTALITGSGVKELVDLTVDLDGRAGGGTAVLTATDNHRIWLTAQRRWVEAGDIAVGDRLRTAAGAQRTIVAVRARTMTTRVHNLTVAGLHTYYVAAGGQSLLVHNEKKDDVPCVNWSPKSTKTFGHSFKTHGAGSKNTQKLKDRARSRNEPQGQWQDDAAAAEFIKKHYKPGMGAVGVKLPPGMGKVIMPDGTIKDAPYAYIIPQPNGVIKTAYPTLGG